MKHVWSVSLGLAVLVLGPGVAAAQQLSPRWEIPGFDFSPNGVWRVRARQVARVRAELLARRDFPSLNAAMVAATPLPGATAVTGTLLVPAIMLRYKDTNLATLRDTSEYSAVLFGSVPPLARPYTVRTYYEQLSHGLFSMQGRVFGWATLDSNEVTYTGLAGSCSGNPFGTTNCNGIFSGNAIARMQIGMDEALAELDSTGIDWGQFDNDGPDGIPNSGDDDGFVDMAIFVHPAQDGACGGATNNHIWSHRFVLLTPYVTKTPAKNGGFIKISDYTFQSGVGGTTACDANQIMPVGTAAHESGHGLDLPDLYDLTFTTEGIGEWGIMGSGNYTSPFSPSRMEAWSLGELGWVNLVPLTTGGVYTLGPAPTSDSAYVIRPTANNPDGEYFLVENRQSVLSDSAMIRLHCARSNNPPGCGGGLLVWHVDSAIAANNGFRQSNSMNSGTIHGLALEEADGLRQLWCGSNGCNRGDAGDPYPGTSGNTSFSLTTNPAALTNTSSSFVGFGIDSIRQLVPNGAMAFRLRFGQPTIVEANDTTAAVLVDGLPHNVYRALLDDGSTHTIGVPDTQVTFDGRTRYTFQSWSDGLGSSHTIIGSLAGASYTVTLAKAYRLDVLARGNGTVTFNPGSVTSGGYVAPGTQVTLTASPTPPLVFDGWGGDAASNDSVISVVMNGPRSLIVSFDPLLAAASVLLPGMVMGTSYFLPLQASGGNGSLHWTTAGGTLPRGLVLDTNGILVGVPAQTGTFTFTARLTSGLQQAQVSDTIVVTAPTLAEAAVVAELLTGASTLTTDDKTYLDLIGNNNGRFDVGDFLAWLRLTGAVPTSPLPQIAPTARPATAPAQKRGAS